MILARTLALPIVLLASLVGLVHSGHRHVAAWAPRTSAGDAVRFLPSGKALRAASLGYEEVIADVFWARATLMFGERYGAGDSSWYPWLYHMMDLATDLDPKLRHAYKYGGTMLRVDGVFVDQSTMLFAKGGHQMPDEWYFPFGIAMNYYMEKDDKALAAEYMRRAAGLPGAPFYLRNLAASLTDESQGLENSLAFLVQEYEGLPEGRAREAVRVKLEETRYRIAVRDAEEVVAQWRRIQGVLPEQPGDVEASGLVLPPDPLGGTWEWDPSLEASPGSLRSTRFIAVMTQLSAETGLGPFNLSDVPGGTFGAHDTAPPDDGAGGAHD